MVNTDLSLNGNRARTLRILSDFISTSLGVLRKGEDRTQDYN